MPPRAPPYGAGPSYHQGGFPPQGAASGSSQQGSLGAAQFMSANPQVGAYAGAGGYGGIGGQADSMAFAGQGGRVPFSHNPALMSQHQAQQSGGHGMRQPGASGSHEGPNSGPRNVWADNFEDEMRLIESLVEQFPYIAMDTEFPGVVARPMGSFDQKNDYHYQTVRVNVDLLKVIQVGIALFNNKGECASTVSRGGGLSVPMAWNFNFRFKVADEMYNQSSLDLMRAAGLDLAVFERDGIDHHTFASRLIASGTLCDDSVTWLSFHGGYDFGYLVHMVFPQMMPRDRSDFFQIMRRFFPSCYDVKFLANCAFTKGPPSGNPPFDKETEKYVSNLQGSLQGKNSLEQLASQLGVPRKGTSHQAGSDAWVTGKVFFAVRNRFFNGTLRPNLQGKIWGITDMTGSLEEQTNAVLANRAIVQPAADQQQPDKEPSGGAGGPSTPNTSSAALAGTTTPAQQQQQQHNLHHHQQQPTNGMGAPGLGLVTPGAGGVFGNFAYAGSSR